MSCAFELFWLQPTLSRKDRESFKLLIRQVDSLADNTKLLKWSRRKILASCARKVPSTLVAGEKSTGAKNMCIGLIVFKSIHVHLNIQSTRSSRFWHKRRLKRLSSPN